jgi:hypothetical protein
MADIKGGENLIRSLTKKDKEDEGEEKKQDKQPNDAVNNGSGKF